MTKNSQSTSNVFDQKVIILIAAIIVLVVFSTTWYTIKRSRADSLELLILQGTAFTESLADVASNALSTENFIDYLVHKRYSEIVVDLTDRPLAEIDQSLLATVARRHGLYGIQVFGMDSQMVAGVTIKGPTGIPEHVIDEVKVLIANPEDSYTLLLEEGDSPEETVHYYLAKSNMLDRITLITTDALYFVDAMEETQIDFLALKMAQERGIEYIMYQTTEGIIFSSADASAIVSIESDPFLKNALDADTILNRVTGYRRHEVLELVRPFSSEQYPFGLLRVGLPLWGYYRVSNAFDTQLIVTAVILAILMLVVILFLNTHRRRKELDFQYRQMKSITDKLFDQMDVGVAAIDDSGKIVMTNKAFDDILGVAGTSGRFWKGLLGELKVTLPESESGQRASTEAEVNFVRGDNARTLLIATSKVAAEGDLPSGVVAVIYDITNVRDYERKAARKERLSEMGNLAAGVAHEIRNPLNAISIAAQRLATEFMPEENSDEYLSFTKQIRDETRRLNDIITRFLALARSDEKKSESIELSRLFDEQVAFLKPEADKLGIELSCDFEPGLRLNANQDELKQVIANLFNNACEAINRQPGKIRIVGRKFADYFEILFEDSGPGVNESDRDKIFAPYFTTKEAGTGLGLPTVHKIISAMDGEITVESSKLGGAAFRIKLPQ
jgi:signal transduction histidine kinase